MDAIALLKELSLIRPTSHMALLRSARARFILLHLTCPMHPLPPRLYAKSLPHLDHQVVILTCALPLDFFPPILAHLNVCQLYSKNKFLSLFL